MSTINIEVARAKASGDQPMDEFTGGVRNLDATALTEGLRITFPEDYSGRIFKTFIGPDKNETQYILVDSLSKEGVQSVIRFYPSTFTKQRMIYEKTEPGKPLRPTGTFARTQGAAAEAFRAYGSVKEAMDSFKGKTIVVTKITPIWTKRFNAESLMEAQITTIDFAD